MGNCIAPLPRAPADSFEQYGRPVGVVEVLDRPRGQADASRSNHQGFNTTREDDDQFDPRVGPFEDLERNLLRRDSSPPVTAGLRPLEQQQVEAPVNWVKGDLIGSGAFGQVYLGLDNEKGQLMAVKQVAISKEEGVAGRVAEYVAGVEAEVAVLKQLEHENIVRYLGTCRTKECLNIFLEFVPGGSIASLLAKFGCFKESVIKLYTRQILEGLRYLHGHKIMHRDIKGANILVDNTGLVKLADFGASKKIESLATIDSGKSIRGTPYWMAPEVIKQAGHGLQADIWSVGCTVIEMMTGKPPWSQYKSQVSALFHIAQSKGPPPLPDNISSEARDFLLLCFNRNPRDRPNAVRLLAHPFLQVPATPAATTSRAAPTALTKASSAGAIPHHRPVVQSPMRGIRLGNVISPKQQQPPPTETLHLMGPPPPALESLLTPPFMPKQPSPLQQQQQQQGLHSTPGRTGTANVLDVGLGEDWKASRSGQHVNISVNARPAAGVPPADLAPLSSSILAAATIGRGGPVPDLMAGGINAPPAGVVHAAQLSQQQQLRHSGGDDVLSMSGLVEAGAAGGMGGSLMSQPRQQQGQGVFDGHGQAEQADANVDSMESNYNPVDEPSWMQSVSPYTDFSPYTHLAAQPANASPRSSLDYDADLMQWDCPPPEEPAAAPQPPPQPAPEDAHDILAFVKEKANSDLMRMSMGFPRDRSLALNLSTLFQDTPGARQAPSATARGSMGVSKEAQWEAELAAELAQQRSAYARRNSTSPAHTASPLRTSQS